MPRNSEKLSIAGFYSKIEVFAWQENLKEVLVIQKAILVRIIVVYQLLTVSLSKLNHPIISQELKNTRPVEIFLCSPIDPHKSGVRTELRVSRTKGLS